MQALSLKQKRHFAQLFTSNTVAYAELDKFCANDITQSQMYSSSLADLLGSIYVGTGKIPVFHEDYIRFEETRYPVAALPLSLKFHECPIANIPGHKKDREIFESFYPVIYDNLGMYFRVALAWLAISENKKAAVLLHVNNRDFDSMRNLKMYVPVITNMDTRMDVVAMSFKAFLGMIGNLGRSQEQPHYLKFDPRSGAQSPVPTKELVPPRVTDQIDHIRRFQYPDFYDSMLEFVKTRPVSTGAYTCGQFLLDLHMRN